MNKKLFLAIVLINSLSFGQTKFNKGFKDGYLSGYCHNQGINCIKPIPPIAPIPNINENSNSYQDGYNKGFELGLNNRKNNVSENRNRFKVAKATYADDGVYQPPVDLMAKLIAVKDKHYKENEDYLYSLLRYLNEVKPYIDKKANKGYFWGRILGEYGVLESMFEDDLSDPKSRRILRDRELSIRELISEYKIYIRDNK